MLRETFKLVRNSKWLLIGFTLFIIVYLLPFGTSGNTVMVSDGRGVVVDQKYVVFEGDAVLTADGKPLVTEDGRKLVVGEATRVREKKVTRNGEKILLQRVITEDGRDIDTEDGLPVFVDASRVVTGDWKPVYTEDGREVKVTSKAVLTKNGKTILGITLMAVVFFVTDAIPFPAVALLIGIFQVFFMGYNPNAVAKSFFSDSVFFIMGSLMIATAIVKQELDKRIALAILNRTGTRLEAVVMGIVATTAILAAFIADHTVAAMFLPVGIALTVKSGENLRQLGKLMMFAIAYGCAIGGLGTPSGGARNVIMIEYWKQMFGVNVGYGQWMLYSFPMVIVMIPVTTFLLIRVFKPEIDDLSVGMETIKKEVAEKGRMTGREWLTIGIFMFTLIMWVTMSTKYGLGIIALLGASLYVIFKLVEWKDYNKGVDWGVVLLYAAAISLGLVMKDTGAARWLAENFLAALAPFGVTSGIPLAGAVALLTAGVSNTMSNGAAVAVIGPVTLNMAVLSGTSIMTVGFATAISSAFAYLLVVGTPPNAIVYASGYVRASDFLKAGWVMFIVSLLILLVFARVWWSVLGLM
jgi:sodium-dependent dicarboxylate transporter 2/3/5